MPCSGSTTRSSRVHSTPASSIRTSPTVSTRFRPSSRSTLSIASTCFRQIEYAGVLHGARNVPGARALIDFMLTRPFQEDMPLQMYVNPVVPGALLPAVFTKWAVDPAHPYSLDPARISAKRNDWIKEWSDLVVH